MNVVVLGYGSCEFDGEHPAASEVVVPPGTEIKLFTDYGRGLAYSRDGEGEFWNSDAVPCGHYGPGDVIPNLALHRSPMNNLAVFQERERHAGHFVVGPGLRTMPDCLRLCTGTVDHPCASWVHPQDGGSGDHDCGGFLHRFAEHSITWVACHGPVVPIIHEIEYSMEYGREWCVRFAHDASRDGCLHAALVDRGVADLVRNAADIGGGYLFIKDVQGVNDRGQAEEAKRHAEQAISRLEGTGADSVISVLKTLITEIQLREYSLPGTVSDAPDEFDYSALPEIKYTNGFRGPTWVRDFLDEVSSPGILREGLVARGLHRAMRNALQMARLAMDMGQTRVFPKAIDEVQNVIAQLRNTHADSVVSVLEEVLAALRERAPRSTSTK
ncbi:hypothetical protein [Streptomyces vinaceus]|uniref:hypothetical protein n=1 Tax=Streptomyces vinaceus TaxID=1960 RepID=UPI003692A104